MARLHKRAFYLGSGFLVPWLTLVGPNWISLTGIGPCWAVLWLLPWALEEGQFSEAEAKELAINDPKIKSICAGAPCGNPLNPTIVYNALHANSLN